MKIEKSDSSTLLLETLAAPWQELEHTHVMATTNEIKVVFERGYITRLNIKLGDINIADDLKNN